MKSWLLETFASSTFDPQGTELFANRYLLRGVGGGGGGIFSVVAPFSTLLNPILYGVSRGSSRMVKSRSVKSAKFTEIKKICQHVLFFIKRNCTFSVKMNYNLGVLLFHEVC